MHFRNFLRSKRKKEKNMIGIIMYKKCGFDLLAKRQSEGKTSVANLVQREFNHSRSSFKL